MTEDFQPIRPRSVPLSHADALRGAPGAEPRPASRWTVPAALTAAALALLAVFVLAPRLLNVPPPPQPAAASATSPAAAAVPAAAPAQVTGNPAPTPPASFGQQQRDQARSAAQTALSRLVELQLRVEQTLQAGSWGAEAYAAAKERALTGDEALARDDFATAQSHYDAAANELERLIADRQSALERALQDGAAALAGRKAEAARAAFALAATIEPQDPRVTAGLTRAERLPQVNELLRTARNQELAGDWDAALDTLRQVQRVDPETGGLAEAMQRATAQAGREHLKRVVSGAFADLDAGRYEAARSAFQQALRLDPDNAAARGGLEQVHREVERTRIERLERDAARALAEERWNDADALFAEALALDPNIQFAIDGRAQASERRRASEALAAILADPDRLSSQRVFEDAQRALAAARAIEPKGAGLTARIAQVHAILQTYAVAIPVVLRSDNATQVTVSTVGPLGTFAEKQLALRPGTYTVVGSRDGCRDVREQIVVRPDMAPVEIRCIDTL